MSSLATHGIGTKLVHGGEDADPHTGAIAPILVRSKTFHQPEFGVESKWQYSRGKNPTRSILEKKLEHLVGEGKATVFGSGDAATTMFLLTLNPGDHIICCKELYGGTIRLFEQLFANFGIETSFVDIEDIEEVRKIKTHKSVAIWVESPTNPKLGIIDLKKVGQIASELELRFIADLTFAPPCTTNPFEFGIETVIYSLSKYFAGHNDVIGGAIVTKNSKLHQRLEWLQWSVGAVLSPDECYRVIQELKTLELRWMRVSKTAQRISEFLDSHEHIKKVYYPGLNTDINQEVLQNQMKHGYGSALSFDLKSNDLELIGSLVRRLSDTGLIVFGESLSSPETILAHPATMSHRSLTAERRNNLGIENSFFRLSVGFEDEKDIISALKTGLDVFNLSEIKTKTRKYKLQT